MNSGNSSGIYSDSNGSRNDIGYEEKRNWCFFDSNRFR